MGDIFSSIDGGAAGYSVDKNPHIAAVDGGNTEMSSFAGTEPCGVDRGEDRSMLEIESGAKQKVDLMRS